MKLNVGDVLRKLRNDRKLTQKQLAKILDVSTISIHSYEKNKRTPGLGFLARLHSYAPDAISEIGIFHSFKKIADPIIKQDPNLYAGKLIACQEKLLAARKEILELKNIIANTLQ